MPIVVSVVAAVVDVDRKKRGMFPDNEDCPFLGVVAAAAALQRPHLG